ncbi:MAG: hypothetical protein KAU12_01685 [Candidatus Omnitrophica bacterium]|nr:hypothetical protein [Candidatus Omnitrophota bacterium]
MKFKVVILSLCLAVIGAGCVHTQHDNDPFETIPAFYRINDNLYRGGCPDMAGLMYLKELKIKTILCFQQPSEELEREESMAQAFGLKFINIPLSVRGMPADKQVIGFLEVVTDKSKFPVFIHGGSGRGRTGVMTAVYRVVVEGWTIKEAYEEAKNLDYWPYQGDAELKRFINQLNDKDIYFIKVGR